MNEKEKEGKGEGERENKATYTAALVADGCAGAENLNKWLWRKDGQTNRRTKKWLIESRVRD